MLVGSYFCSLIKVPSWNRIIADVALPYFYFQNDLTTRFSITQSKKFDPDGEYIRKYIPELKNIPNKYIHLPSELDDKSLSEFGIRIGHLILTTLNL